MVQIPQHPDYFKNLERCGDKTPCIVCGKAVTAGKFRMVHVHCGGTHVVTEDEAATLDPMADLSFYPIGRECLKNYPQLRPYVVEA